MAKVLVEYSLEVRPGWMVTISSTTAAVPLVQAVYRRVLAVGGHPYVLMEPPGVKDLLMRTGSNMMKPAGISTSPESVAV